MANRPLRVIVWEKVKWQEAFPIGRGKFLCPYCGDEVRGNKPWGLCLTQEELKIPRNKFPGKTVVTCPLCKIPFLKPKREERKDEEKEAA